MHVARLTLYVSFQPKYISQVSLWPKQNSVSVHLTNFHPFRYFVPVLLELEQPNSGVQSIQYIHQGNSGTVQHLFIFNLLGSYKPWLLVSTPGLVTHYLKFPCIHICVHSWHSILATAFKLPIIPDSHKSLRMHFTGLEN